MILGGSPYPAVRLENLFDLLKSGNRICIWYVFVSKNLFFCFEKAYFKPHDDILNALFLNNQPRFGMCRSQNVRLTILFLNKLIPKLSL